MKRRKRDKRNIKKTVVLTAAFVAVLLIAERTLPGLLGLLGRGGAESDKTANITASDDTSISANADVNAKESVNVGVDANEDISANEDANTDANVQSNVVVFEVGGAADAVVPVYAADGTLKADVTVGNVTVAPVEDVTVEDVTVNVWGDAVVAEATEPAEPTTEPTPEPTTEQTPEPTTEPTPEPTEEPIQEPTEDALIAPPPASDFFPAAVRDPYYTDAQYGSMYDSNGDYSSKAFSWYFNPNKEHQPVTAMGDFDFRKLDGLYLGDVNSRNIYLTFDEGYEAGHTPKILDTLRDRGVKGAFFVTGQFVDENPGLIQRMVNEGHIVANHTVHHKNSTELTKEQFTEELRGVEMKFKQVTGQDLPKYFRPPAGNYSAKVLSWAKEMGYATVFWSFAYRDWLVDDQPPRQQAFDQITSRMHGGAVPLLHAVSKTNADVLGDVVDFLLEKGCTFRPISDIIYR